MTTLTNEFFKQITLGDCSCTGAIIMYITIYFSNIFSEIAYAIKAKISIVLTWEGGT